MTRWHETLSVPRTPFIPPVVWVDHPTTDGFVAVDRERDPDAWQAAVDADAPVVTQVDDGRTPPGAVGTLPTSSSSQPSLVATMLSTLGVRPGDRVLEIGTGTGWNAALLSDATGPTGHVVSVEIDPNLATAAERALRTLGFDATIVVGDGLLGHPPAAPYDRVICTASVRHIPRPWIDQTRAGGVIVAPWGTDYGHDALTRLTVHPDGSASGRLGSGLAFMRVRTQRRTHVDPHPTDLHQADTSHTTRGARDMFDLTAFDQAAFTIGLHVPNCYLTIDDPEPDRRHIEFHDPTTHSWAQVDMTHTPGPWQVRQFGPRHLWNEVDQALTWWHHNGKPHPDAYTLTITPDGDHHLSLD